MHMSILHAARHSSLSGVRRLGNERHTRALISMGMNGGAAYTVVAETHASMNSPRIHVTPEMFEVGFSKHRRSMGKGSEIQHVQLSEGRPIGLYTIFCAVIWAEGCHVVCRTRFHLGIRLSVIMTDYAHAFLARDRGEVGIHPHPGDPECACKVKPVNCCATEDGI